MTSKKQQALVAMVLALRDTKIERGCLRQLQVSLSHAQISLMPNSADTTVDLGALTKGAIAVFSPLGDGLHVSYGSVRLLYRLVLQVQSALDPLREALEEYNSQVGRSGTLGQDNLR